MSRRIRLPLLSSLIVLTAFASFAFGQRMRERALPPEATRVRLSAMPEVGVSGLAVAQGGAELSYDTSQTFLEVLRYVKSEYVDRIDDERKLGFGAVRTMLVSLDDPKTRFYDPTQRSLLLARLNGEFKGVGATIAVIKQTRSGIDQRRLAVVAPVPGGPAERAGLRPGDVITEIDGRWIIAYDARQDLNRLRTEISDEKELKKAVDSVTARTTAGIGLPKAIEALTSRESGDLKLTIERSGQTKPFEVSLHTGATRLEPVSYREIDAKTSYLRVTQFNERSSQAIEQAIAKAKGRSLVLDLRNNAGGPIGQQGSGALSGVITLLGKLLPPGPVATVHRPGGRTETVEVTEATATAPKLAVLVNGGTSNVAELAAAALREKAGAKLIGEQTFGDSSWLKLHFLRDGAAMTVNAGKMLTSRGADFTGGLKPDVPLATGGPSDRDSLVERAAEELSRG